MKNLEILNNLAFNKTELIIQFRADNAALLTNDYLRSDSYIFGLFRANKMDKELAAEALKETVDWRSENQIDKLGEAPYDPKLADLFPLRLNSFTKEGCPVLEWDFGKWLVADYYLNQTYLRDVIKDFDKYQTQMWEKTRRAVIGLMPKCEQAVLLANIEGFEMKNIDDAKAVPALIDMMITLDGRYTNVLKTLICIKANPDFVTLIKFLAPYLGITRESMEIFFEADAEKAKVYIDNYIDRSTLSKPYYGTK